MWMFMDFRQLDFTLRFHDLDLIRQHTSTRAYAERVRLAFMNFRKSEESIPSLLPCGGGVAIPRGCDLTACVSAPAHLNLGESWSRVMGSGLFGNREVVDITFSVSVFWVWKPFAPGQASREDSPYNKKMGLRIRNGSKDNVQSINLASLLRRALSIKSASIAAHSKVTSLLSTVADCE